MSKRLLTTMVLGLAMSSLTGVNIFDSNFYSSKWFSSSKEKL